LSYGLGIVGGGSNILINGGFEIWQRGTSFSGGSLGGYCADRWQILGNGSPTWNFSQESSIVDSGLYALKMNVTAVGGSTVIYAQQIIENGQAYAGKTVSISVRVKCSTIGVINIGMTDGVTFSFSPLNVSTSYETLTFTKNIATNATGMTVFVGFVGAGPSTIISTTYIDSVMMVVGQVPQAFVPADPQQDLARCQRYYEQGDFGYIFTGYFTTSGTTGIVQVPFRATKRVVPTLTNNFNNLSNITGGAVSLGANLNSIAVNFSVSSTVVYQIASGGVPWTAEAD
jgi:hypothetical protein